MKKFLRPYLNVPEIEALGGEYEGVVANVSDTEIRNRYTGQKSMEPMIEFMDGNRLILNKGALRQCIEWFGPESENWIGRRLKLFLRRVERIDRVTGEHRKRVQRALLCEDIHARVSIIPIREQAPAVTREPGEDDADDARVSAEADDAVITAEQIFGENRRAR